MNLRKEKINFQFQSSKYIPEIQKSKFAGIFEDLIGLIEKQQEELSRYEIISKIFSLKTNAWAFNDILEHLIQILQIPHQNNIRFLIYSTSSNDQENERIVYSGGVFADDYSYLDDQIIMQLNDKSPFIVADTSKTRSIKYLPDKPYPKAIVAYKLGNEQNKIGFFWIGFEDAIKISRDDFVYFNQIYEAVSSVICSYYISQDIVLMNKVIMQLLDLFEDPVLFLKKGRIFYSNKMADLLLDDSSTSQRDYEMVNQIQGILKSIPERGTSEVVIKDSKYHLLQSELISEYDTSYQAIIFQNLSSVGRQRETLALILDTISQYLRSPTIESLASLKMLPLMGDLTTIQITYIENIKHNLETGLQVLDDLTTIDRITSGKGLIFNNIGTDEIIDFIITLLKPKAKQKRLEFQINRSEGKFSIYTDKTLITLSLFHVLDYAIDQSKVGGFLSLEENYTRNNWQFMIHDTSKIITKVEIERIFQPEFQKEKEKSLILAQRIITFLGGKLTIKSGIDKGCQYILELDLKTTTV